MTKKTSFNYQKQVLEELKEYLVSFNQNIYELSRQYESALYDFYDEKGIMEEIYDEYKEIYLSKTVQSLKDLSERFEGEDIPFIEREIDFLSSR